MVNIGIQYHRFLVTYDIVGRSCQYRYIRIYRSQSYDIVGWARFQMIGLHEAEVHHDATPVVLRHAAKVTVPALPNVSSRTPDWPVAAAELQG